MLFLDQCNPFSRWDLHLPPKAARALVLLAAIGAKPTASYPQSSQVSASGTFDVASDADFRSYEQVVTRFAHQRRPGGENDFCEVGLTASDGSKSVWVIWDQGRQMLLWEGQPALSMSRRIIRLKSDVVPKEEDLHGSTYRVTKAWVEEITATCDRSGVKIRVPKRRGHSPH